MVLATFLLVFAVMMSWGTSTTGAFAAGGAAVNQCNGTDNVGGKAVACTVTVTNHLDLATGTKSSTVKVKECHGAAHAPPTCTTTTKPFTQLTTSVTQCNGSGNGGGGTVTCSVSIVNDITGKATTSPATVNQCNTAGTGGGTQPTKVCSPIGSTTGATVTQCNSAGKGGGGTRRVKCRVTTSTKTAALPVTINQCVGSGNGGGATVTCTARVTNHIIAPKPTPTVSPTVSPSTSPLPSTSATPSPKPTASKKKASPTPTPTKTATRKPRHPGGHGHLSPPKAPGGGGRPPTSPPLPFTGFNTEPLLLAALAALLAGGFLLTIARRRPIRGRHALAKQ